MERGFLAWINEEVNYVEGIFRSMYITMKGAGQGVWGEGWAEGVSRTCGASERRKEVSRGCAMDGRMDGRGGQEGWAAGMRQGMSKSWDSMGRVIYDMGDDRMDAQRNW